MRKAVCKKWRSSLENTEITLRAKVVKNGLTSRTLACSLYANTEEFVRAQVNIVMNGAGEI